MAMATDSSDTAPLRAANPPSSTALGSGRPVWARASSVAGTVQAVGRGAARSRSREPELLDASAPS